MPQIFQPSVGNAIPPPPPSISEMMLTRSKRKVVQDDEDDDVQIVTPSALKRKTTAKKVTKKIMKEKEGELKKITSTGKMSMLRWWSHHAERWSPSFSRMQKKQGMLNFPMCSISKIKHQIGAIGPFKGLSLGLLPLSPPFPPWGGIKACGGGKGPCTLRVKAKALALGHHHSLFPLHTCTNSQWLCFCTQITAEILRQNTV